MPLIKSISWIRWTIWGQTWQNLTPVDVVKFTAAYATWIKQESLIKHPKIVVGKDARPSWNMIENLAISTLISLGSEVINIWLASTPTTEIAVTEEQAAGGIVITASHNPKERNALKFLNSQGEFLTDEEGKKILDIAQDENFDFVIVDDLGTVTENFIYDEIHIQKILDLKMVDIHAIRQANFTVALDAVNSVGGVVIPKLLHALGVQNIIPLYCEPTWDFPHNPEPLQENLTAISEIIRDQKADLGIVVDPDVDRLALVNEDGTMFGEEYTLVAVADYILSHKVGKTVSNYLSSWALRDITLKHKGAHYQCSVGEVNVVTKMKETKSIIGWEWNGGIIYPALHFGRDALVGIALFLTHLAKSGQKMSQLRASYPGYVISKNKVKLGDGTDPDTIIQLMKQKYESEDIALKIINGIRMEFEDSWVHFRKSNTEPIIRIYAEASTLQQAQELADRVILDIENLSV